MGVKIQTIKEIRFYIAGELDGLYQDDEIRALTNLVIKAVLGITKMHQVYISDQSVSSSRASEIINICHELKRGKPIQYILGETVFYDCIIRLSSATLIPRPETEELADLIIRENRGYKGNIIDIGTGSGCIAIALAANIPGSVVTGTDISDDALTIAGENAKKNNVTIRFIKDDILIPGEGPIASAGIIVSNPPYVRNSEKSLMNLNVLGFEPHSALFVDDSDPLLFYRAILERAEKVLEPGGKIYFEINEALGKDMSQLFGLYPYSEIEILRDLNGKERIIKALRHGR